MCRMCEGFSLEDVLALDTAAMAEDGFIVVGVSGPDDADHHPRDWAYTVGLLDAVNHPEMIVAGISAEMGGSLLSMLADDALAGERFEVGDTIDLGRGVARVGAVNEVQYGFDTFNMWRQLQDFGTVQTPELEAVQIVLPPPFFCSVHDRQQPLLDDPDARINVRRRPPNRAERRRRPPPRRRSA